MEIVRLVQKFFLYGEKDAIHCQDNTISYRHLFNNIMTVASGFHYFGFKPGEFIAIYLENSFDYIYAFYAGFLNGLTVLPMSPNLRINEVKRILYTTGCKQIITSPDCYEKIKTHDFINDTLENVILIDESRDSLSWAKDMIGQNNEMVLTNYIYKYDSLRGGMMFFTSGSTGKPKGILHNYDCVVAVGAFYERNFHYSRADNILITMTLGYVVGAVMQMMSGLYVGATLFLENGFSAKRVLESIQNDELTSAFITPAQLSDLIDLAESDDEDYSDNQLSAFYSGGNLVSANLIERFTTLFNIPPVQVWGMTECFNVMLNDNTNPDKIGALGRPFGETHVCVINQRGEEAFDGEVGELCVKTPMMFQGYYKDEASTENSMICGFLKTGDLVYRDQDDYIWFKGRKKHIIVCDSSNISPEEVEQALSEYCGISKSCVFGKADQKKGEVPVVVIEGEKHIIALKEMQQSLEGKLAHFKIPQDLYFLSHFPSLTSGKIDIKKLKAMVLNNRR